MTTILFVALVKLALVHMAPPPLARPSDPFCPPNRMAGRLCREPRP